MAYILFLMWTIIFFVDIYTNILTIILFYVTISNLYVDFFCFVDDLLK